MLTKCERDSEGCRSCFGEGSGAVSPPRTSDPIPNSRTGIRMRIPGPSRRPKWIVVVAKCCNSHCDNQIVGFVVCPPKCSPGAGGEKGIEKGVKRGPLEGGWELGLQVHVPLPVHPVRFCISKWGPHLSPEIGKGAPEKNSKSQNGLTLGEKFTMNQPIEIKMYQNVWDNLMELKCNLILQKIYSK